MSERQGFEHLKEDFPEFIIKNKDTIPRSLLLKNNEDVLIAANTEAPLTSDEFIQVPDNRYFRFIYPDIATLVEYGIIQSGNKSSSTPVSSSESEDTSTAPKSKKSEDK